MNPATSTRRYRPLSEDQKARIIEIAMADLRRQARAAEQHTKVYEAEGGDRHETA